MLHDPTHQSRASIRREMRGRRRELDRRVAARYGRLIMGSLWSSGLLARCRHVAAYLSNDGEPDLSLVIARLLGAGRKVYLPVIRGGELAFAPYAPGCAMRENRFGILEPQGVGRSELRGAARLDVVLMPLVAFDDQGNRLGMGGGFYDKTFEFLAGAVNRRQPRLIGIAYDCQRHPALPCQDWDVPLAAVATERGVRLFAGRRPRPGPAPRTCEIHT